MNKKALAALCAAAVAASCCTALNVFADGEMTVIEPTSEYVKPLGRTYYNGESLWLSLTAAGIEYQFTGTTTQVTITGDSGSAGEVNNARICFYADGERVKDTMLTETTQTFTLDLGESALHTVRVVKLSESPNGSILIDEIAVDGEGDVAPTPEKAHKIEFIGDSITCGYGVDGANQNEHFVTSTEDGSRTYAYKAAKKLDADYSMVSYSGYGVLSGYTSANATKPNKDQTVGKYYDKVGFSWGWIDGKNITDVEWDFSYTPDLVVINLGTNDASYTQGKEDRIAEFTAEYVNFLKLIREKNPDAEILCTLGIMGQDLYPAIEDAVELYTTETGDDKVNTLQFDVQSMDDGLGSDWHPSEVTHTKAAEKLVDRISELYGWDIDENADISPVDGKLVPEGVDVPEDSSSEAPDSSSEESSETSSEDVSSSESAESSSSDASSASSSASSAAASSSAAGTTKGDSNPTTGASSFAGAAVLICAAAAITVKKRNGRN